MISKLANDPIKKKLKVQGITIWLEWLKGEERTYYNHDPLKVNSKGKLDYKTKMKADYGYVPKRMDADGEDLDVYLGPNHESTKVYVIKQIRPSDGSFDEHKIMLGYDSPNEAKKSYLAHMPKKYLGSIRPSNIEMFKREFLKGKARFSKKANTYLPDPNKPKKKLSKKEYEKLYREIKENIQLPFTKNAFVLADIVSGAAVGGAAGIAAGRIGAKKEKQASAARVGALAGGLVGGGLDAHRHSKKDEGSWTLPVAAAGGASSGALGGKVVGNAKEFVGGLGKHEKDIRKYVINSVRNPLIGGAILVGGGAAALAARKKRKVEAKGEKYEGRSPLSAGLSGAMFGAGMGAYAGSQYVKLDHLVDLARKSRKAAPTKLLKHASFLAFSKEVGEIIG